MTTEKEYLEIWQQTQKAVRYLRKKGCFTLCDSIKMPFPGSPVAEMLTYRVSDTTESMQAHVAKQYPRAMVSYVDRATVVYGQLERQKAFAEYRMSL